MKTEFVIFEGIYIHSKYVFKSLKDYNNVIFAKIPDKGLVGKLNHYHTSEKINRVINLPLKSLWYTHYLGAFNDADRYIIVFMEGCRQAYDEELLNYLRNRLTDCKLVYYFLNSAVELSQKRIEYINSHFDFIVSYDKDDCEKYGWNYYCGIYCYDDMVSEKDKSDVFFVGKNKGRLDAIYNSFRRFRTFGLKCDYFVVDVTEENQALDGIVYNKRIPYYETLSRVKGTRFLFENVQENQSGCTFRTYESIVYDKVLITNNNSLKDTRIYDPNKMIIYSNIDDIRYEDLLRMEALPRIIHSTELSPSLFIKFLEENVYA